MLPSKNSILDSQPRMREKHYFKAYYFNNVTWDYNVHQSNVLEAGVHPNLEAKLTFCVQSL